MFKFNEKIYKTNLPIKYIFKEGKLNKKNLIVVFSAFNSPKSKIQHSYNYIRSLNKIDCNKLFILDNYGPRGCYYIGENMNFQVESAVLSLITYIARKYDIRFENIISIGSSKGGSAALYFGLKYNFGYIISGTPQTKIANYILNTCEETSDYMLGKDKTVDKVECLDSIIYNQLQKEVLSKIYIFTSINDWQYKYHVEPFVDALSKKNADVKVCINNHMEKHSEIGKYFPEYLINTLTEILYNFSLVDYKVNADNNKVKISVNINKYNKNIDSNYHFKYIIKANERNNLEYTTEKEEFTFTPDNAGVYKIFLQVYYSNLNFYEFELGEWLIGKDEFRLDKVNMEICEDKLKFSLDLEAFVDLEYAFYILKDGKIIKKIWYQEKNEFTYDIKEQGEYRVMYFINTSRGNKVMNMSKVIKK